MSDDENYPADDASDDGSKADENAEDLLDDNDPDKPLCEEDVHQSISLLCKTGDGLSHAYVKLDVRERHLTDVNILEKYIHLRYVDVSKNNLVDISPLSALAHMLVLKADQNKLRSVQLEQMPYLVHASFNYNRITNTHGLNHPQLEHLALNFNEISEVSDLDPSCLAHLHTLELRGNRLTQADGIHLPNLKNLFLACNLMKEVSGLERLHSLTTLHLRENQIHSLGGFSDAMSKLQYLNLRGNNITNVKEVKKIQVLPLLRAAVFKDNPIASEDDYRLEMLIALRRLERLDKDDYTDDERQEAEETYEQRRLEEINQNEGAEEMLASDDE